MSTKSDQLEWRRSKVVEIRAGGMTHNNGQAQTTAYYAEYLKLVQLDEITKVYLEFKGNVSYFVSLCKAPKAAKMGIPQVLNLLRIANNYLPSS